MSESGQRRRRRRGRASSRESSSHMQAKTGKDKDPVPEQNLLGELSTRLKEILLARARKHSGPSCCSSCTLQTKAAVDPRCWLAQGTYNIVLFPDDAHTQDYVHRWSFLAYENDTVADARVSWAQALRDAGIGASRDSRYQRITDAELQSFIETFKDLKDRCRGTLKHCHVDCKKDLEEQIEKVNQKTKNAKVLMANLAGESGCAFYLFRDGAEYARNDLEAWLQVLDRTSEARQSAWEATYEVIQRYAKLFVKRLASEPESDALVVDLQLGNFLVYENTPAKPSAGLVSGGRPRVLLGDADMHEGLNNAPASELSLGSLELLSDENPVAQTNTGVAGRLALGMLATLLANAKPRLEEANNRPAFKDGLTVLRKELERAAAPLVAQAQLLSSAISLVANLHFQAQPAYYTFSELLEHYVEAKTGLVGYHRIQNTQVRRAVFAQLHDLYQGLTAPTVAAERYLDLLSEAFACGRCSRTKGKAWVAYLEKLQEFKSHHVPEWLKSCDIQEGLLTQLQTWSAGPDVLRAEARGETLVFWKQLPGMCRRTNIATFGFVEASGLRYYLQWVKIFWENRVGVGEVGSSVPVRIPKSEHVIVKMLSVLKSAQKRRQQNPELRLDFAKSASSLLQRALKLSLSLSKGKAEARLVRYTQSNDHGLLTDYLMLDNSRVAGQAWKRVLLLMQRYARLLCRQADQAKPMCLLGRWDPSYIVVYRYVLSGQDVVKVRLLDTLLLACSNNQKLVQQARELCAAVNKQKTQQGLAALSYLTLLANGAECIPRQALQSRQQALAPLLELLGSWEPKDWKRLLSEGPKLAAQLEMASEHGLARLMRISNLCRKGLAQQLNEVLNAVWSIPQDTRHILDGLCQNHN